MPPQTPLVFVVGATGAQGIPIVQSLVRDGAYRVRFLTRDSKSARAKSLLGLGDVEAIEGTFASEEDLRRGFHGADYAFVNIDGFNSGEKTEIFWSVRAYELALEENIRFFVFGALDYAYKIGGYDPKFRAGHYDAKGRVAEWILQQAKDQGDRKKMGVAVFTSGPYLSMAIGKGTPMSPTVEDGVVTWRLPLGKGAVAHVDLEDCGYYVRWLFDNQDKANGVDLQVAIDLMTYDEVALAFEKVTGHPARFIDTDLDEYWTSGGPMGEGKSSSAYNSDLSDPAAMTLRENFTGFWNIWRHSGGNKGVVRRNFGKLDEIHPGRIKSAEEWFRREDETGRKAGLGSLWERVNDLRPVLKIAEDGRKGKI